jgi:hypothetical protein
MNLRAYDVFKILNIIKNVLKRIVLPDELKPKNILSN